MTFELARDILTPVAPEDMKKCPHCGSLFVFTQEYPVCEDCYVGK